MTDSYPGAGGTSVYVRVSGRSGLMLRQGAATMGQNPWIRGYGDQKPTGASVPL